MKAIRIHQFGETDAALQYEDVPDPVPADDELLIEVHAASLNRADLGVRSGQLAGAGVTLPLIPGREFSGRVLKAGVAVSDFRPGDRVVAYTLTGGYAELAVAKPSQVRPIPNSVDAVTAAAIPTAFLTAWFGLLDSGRLTRGEWLLVHAGSSGVGVAAIQIGTLSGADVAATTSSDEKAEKLRELGARLVIDYTARDFVPAVLEQTNNRGADVILEMVGGDNYERSLQALAPGGRLVSLGGAFGRVPSTPPELTGGRTATHFSITRYLQQHPESFRQLDQLVQLVDRRKIRVPVERTFPLSEARAAQRFLEGRGHFGKIVLVPRSSPTD